MNLEALVRALSAERQLADWSARGVARQAAWLRRTATDSAAGERQTLALTATVHRDSPAGRGSAAFTLGPDDAVAGPLDAALMRASAAGGPAWRSPAAAAPARVELADPAFTGDALVAAPAALAGDVAAAARAAGAEVLDVLVEVERDATAVITRRGLDARWLATRCTIEARLRRGGVVADVRQVARRRDALTIGSLIADALDAAQRRAGAPAPPAGRLPVVMRAAALLHGGRGLFEALVAQADPALERQGLVRYRPGQPIAPGAAAAAEPLTITSDGTLPFGLRSAPLDDAGDAVRRFELVGRGVARGLALDARAAALRGAAPNGGVRGLIVALGSAPEAELLAGGPLLVVERLEWLELSPITGLFRAAVGLGQLVDRGQRLDVRGGILRGDALAALALARRGRDEVTTPEYRGPALWHLGELTID